MTNKVVKRDIITPFESIELDMDLDDHTKKYEAGEIIKILRGHTNVVRDACFSHDNTKIISGSVDYTVKVWDIETGKILLDFKEHMDKVQSVAFSPDGKLGMSGSHDKTVKVFDIETGTVLLDFKGHSDWVSSVAFSPDGKLGMSGSDDNTVKVWDIETGEVLLDFKGHSGWIRSVAFSPDGKLGMSGGWDKIVKVWDIETGEVLLNLKGHTNTIRTVAFSPDGKLGMSGSDDGIIKVWSIKTGEVLLDFKEHTDNVFSVTFSPDGRFGMSGSSDKTVKVWDIETGEVLLDYTKYKGWINPSNFSPDMKMGVCAGQQYSVHIFSLDGVLFDPNRYLYRKNDVIYQVTPEEIIETPTQELTKELFEEYGTTDISLFQKLDNQGEILISRDIEREGVPKAHIKGYNSPQLIKSTGDIRLDGVGKVNKLTLKANDPNQQIRVLFSLDSGETWCTKTQGQEKNDINIIVDTDDYDAIREHGLTINEFNNINERWTQDILHSGKIRFAYFFDIDNTNTKSEIDQLSINVNMYGMWVSQYSEEVFEFEYTNDEIIMEFYKNGTYKINYEQ